MPDTFDISVLGNKTGIIGQSPHEPSSLLSLSPKPPPGSRQGLCPLAPLLLKKLLTCRNHIERTPPGKLRIPFLHRSLDALREVLLRETSMQTFIEGITLARKYQFQSQEIIQPNEDNRISFGCKEEDVV